MVILKGSLDKFSQIDRFSLGGKTHNALHAGMVMYKILQPPGASNILIY